MRYAILVLALLLGGCIASASDLRAPESPDEHAAVQKQIARVNPALSRMMKGNQNLCVNDAQHCRPSVEVNYSWRVGAFATETKTYFSSGLLERLDTEDEMVIVAGHEWGHQLLRHTRDHKAGRQTELDADCVGAMMVIQSGYNIATARRAIGDVLANVEAAETLKSIAGLVLIGMIPGSSDQPSASERLAHIDGAASKANMNRLNGKPLDRDSINEICGTRL